MPLPTQIQFREMFPTEQATVNYLMNNNLFYTEHNCSECGTQTKRYGNPDRFVCNKRGCTKRGSRISVRIGTFFYKSHMSCLEILNLAHLWLCEVHVKSCILLTGHSSTTVCAYYAHFRQLVTSSLSEEDQVIGGEGVIVEIDETKLGKRKYNRGHRVDGVWVLVGIERNSGGKIFLVPVPNRSAETLRMVIASHVRPGSIVNTDLWRGYRNLEDLNLTHVTVNHSQSFVDPVTLSCTNTAEGLNSGLKRKIPIRNRVKNEIRLHLGEYV